MTHLSWYLYSLYWRHIQVVKPREADGTAIVDPARAVLFTFTTAGTATEFTFTPGANNIGEKSFKQVTQWNGGIAIVRE